MAQHTYRVRRKMTAVIAIKYLNITLIVGMH